MFNWLRKLVRHRQVLSCPHLFWPELSGGRVVGRRCSTCGKYQSMADIRRTQRVR